tara:strand:+ start:171 stop:581 length:411 start_codon:yes stop_codon:yes gene_type:complete
MQKNTYTSKTELRVRWSECDMQGIAFNAIYMIWSEIAFQEHFRSLNLNIYELGKENIFDSVIVHSNIDYKLPARLDETLDIYSKVKKIGTSSFIMEFKIINQKKELLTYIENTYVSYDRIKEKSKTIPEDIRKILT